MYMYMYIAALLYVCIHVYTQQTVHEHLQLVRHFPSQHTPLRSVSNKFKLHISTTTYTCTLYSQQVITYCLLLCCVQWPATIGWVGDVERMVLGQVSRVISSKHNEGVGLPSFYHQLRDESAINEPRNTPPSSTWRHMIETSLTHHSL